MRHGYPGRAPAYVRIRIEYCAARGEKNQVKTYMSRCFTSPYDYEGTVNALLSYYDSDALTKAERRKLHTQLREAKRRERADIPHEVDFDQLLAKRRQIAKSTAQRFKHKDLLKVFKRVPMRDFNTYRATVQRYLVRYLAQGNKTAKDELFNMGMRWTTYEPGKPQSLFRGKKRAKRRH